MTRKIATDSETCFVVVAGARPNFMKIAPIMHAFQMKSETDCGKRKRFRVLLVHTGQHYDPNMSDIFFSELGIPAPDRHLEVGSGTHAEQTAKVMIEFEKVLLDEKPDCVIVVGDVNSTVACSLTARKMGIKVAHVESGLRSFDMGMPEEINRIVTDSISNYLFVTEKSGEENLLREGISKDIIHLTGNVMIDTLYKNLDIVKSPGFKPDPLLRSIVEKKSPYAVLTLHRPSNVDRKEILLPIWDAICDISDKLEIVFPVHPRTRHKIESIGKMPDRIRMIEPVGYHDMLFAISHATLVLTDSGGLQEETTALKIPCVTIRENTERPITIEIGSNYLVGTRPEAIRRAVDRILTGKGKDCKIPPFWDGHSAERIVDILLNTT